MNFDDIKDKPFDFPENGKVISFSQMAMYNSCQRQWKLRYIDKHRINIENIYAVYGTAMHEILQTYLYIYYNKTIREADEMNFTEILRDKIFTAVSDIRQNNKPNDITREQVQEYYISGINILEWFRKNKTKYFSKKGYELYGIETPILSEIRKNVYFMGYIDLIIKDTDLDTYTLYDIKTSNKGWSRYQKTDMSKYGQLLLYKHFFMQDNNIENNKKIIPEYFIVKKDLKDLSEYGRVDKHIQTFTPANGKIKLKQVNLMMDNFVDAVFTDNGEYNVDRKYSAVSGKNNWNCNFCPYKDRHNLCNPNERIEC